MTRSRSPLATLVLAISLIPHGCGNTNEPAMPPPNPDAAADVDAPPPVERAGITCAPRDVAAIELRPSFSFHQGVCTDADIDVALACVLDLSASTDCDAIAKREGRWAACMDCLLSDIARERYGAAVVADGVAFLNVGGCIQNFAKAGDCGDRYGMLDRCVIAACNDDCSARTSVLHYEACSAAATAGVCAKYDDRCTENALAADGFAAECAVGRDFRIALRRYARMFCAGTADAGTDAD